MARDLTLEAGEHDGTTPTRSSQRRQTLAAGVGARRTQRAGAALVCVGLGVYGAITAWLLPLSARMHYDPSLQYMLSSLAWFRGGSYSYIDHPGTPVEVLGTFMLALSYPLTASRPDGFVTFQLSHPQQFLSLVQTLLVLASAIVCGLVAWRSVVVVHWSQALLGTALAALFFVVVPGAFESLALWSHESFCFPAGTLLSLVVLVVLRRTGCPRWRVVLGLGFAAGVLSSIQLYFVAWIVGTGVALSIAARLSGSSWRSAASRAAVAAAAAGLGFIVATLPIREHYRALAGWIRLLIFHQGNYGGGADGFSSPDLLTSNLAGLAPAAPLLFVVSAASMVVLVGRLWLTRGRPVAHLEPWAAGVGFAAQLLVLVVLVGKHPGVRYLLPLAATLPLVLAAALDRVDVRRSGVRLLLVGFGLSVLAGFGASLSGSIAAHVRAADELRRDDLLTERALTSIAADRHISRAALRTLWTYGTSSPCYALWFGDDSADQTFRDDIARLCPNDANLNVWSAEVTTVSGQTKLIDDREWDVVVVPADLLPLLPPRVVGAGAPPSSVPSLGFGRLVFVIPPSESGQ